MPFAPSARAETGPALLPTTPPEELVRDVEAARGEPSDASPLLDPLELVLAGPAARSEVAPIVASRGAALEPLVAELVRHIAWGGDRRRGAARIELGSGRFAGASVVIHADAGELSLELSAPPGVDAALLAERLRERLQSRGLVLRELSVR